MRYLVTGATGFLGRHVVRVLVEAKHQVVALCRGDDADLRSLGAEVVKGDVLDPASIKPAVKGVDGVLHCAGMVSRDPADAEAMWRVHVLGTRNVLREARSAGCRRAVVASTSGTIAVSTEPRFHNESDPAPIELIARWPYYRSKLYAEMEAFEHNGKQTDGTLEVVAVNPALLLGPGDIHGSSTEDVRLVLEGKVAALPNGGVAFVDVRDAALMMVAALHQGKAGQRYLLASANIPTAEFLQRIARAGAVEAPWLHLPKQKVLSSLLVSVNKKLVEAMGGKEPVSAESVELAQHFWYVDASLAKRDLGFAPRDPQGTIHDTIEDLYARGVVWPKSVRRAATKAPQAP